MDMNVIGNNEKKREQQGEKKPLKFKQSYDLVILCGQSGCGLMW